MRPSTLRLNQEQESDLIEYIKRRVKELERDNKERIAADKKSDLTYRLQQKARALPGTLFEQSNFPVPLTAWVVDHFSARSEDEVLGRDPCVHFTPQGSADVDVARGIDRLAAYKLFTQGSVKTDLQKSIYPVFAHRALILKATYAEKFNEWEEYDHQLLHDAATGAPVEILNHGFILRDVDTFTTVADMATGQERQQLDADPTFAAEPGRHYFAPAPKPVRFKERLYAAPKSMQVDSDRFLAPSNVRTLDDADFIAETYDKKYSWVLEQFSERPWLTSDALNAKLRGDTAEKKTKGKRAEISRENLSFDYINSNHGILECWVQRDVLGWGKPQQFRVFFMPKHDIILSCDFAVKITPQGRQPYTAIAIWQQDDVWWGYSIPEMLEPIQDYVDLQFNRHSHRNAINSNPIVGEHAEAIEGNRSFSDLKPFDVVPLAEGKTIRDWIETFVFPNADQDTQDLIDKAIYWVNFWLGISNIARGDYSDVPQNTTLGGQEATLKEASKLSRRWTRRLITGLEDHLTLLVRVMVATMDEEEAFIFLEGDARQMGVLEAARVRDILIDAKLVFNVDQTSKSVEVNRLSLEIVEKYANFLITAPWIIPMVRPLMKSSLYLLGHDDVDTMLPLPPMIPPMPIMAPQPLGGATTEAGVEPGAAAVDPAGTVPFAAPAAPGAVTPQPAEAVNA